MEEEKFQGGSRRAQGPGQKRGRRRKEKLAENRSKVVGTLGRKERERHWGWGCISTSWGQRRLGWARHCGVVGGEEEV